MKKTLMIVLITVFLTMFLTGNVLAEKESPVIRGEIIAINQAEETISISTEDGNIVVIHVPKRFDFDKVSIGSLVQAKIQKSQSSLVIADWIKEINQGDDDLETEEEEEKEDKNKEEFEGKSNSSYCSDKKESEHPFAAAISDTYSTSVSVVMDYFCQGYGFGEVMLALQTNQINNEEVSTMLDLRRSGQGWGQIWQDMKLIGNRDKAKSPPGQLKKGSN